VLEGIVVTVAVGELDGTLVRINNNNNNKLTIVLLSDAAFLLDFILEPKPVNIFFPLYLYSAS
jgi:hypothetical protein